MKQIRSWENLFLVFVAYSMLSGCATNKAEPSDSFIAPISDQTFDLISDVKFELQLADSVLLNHYLNSGNTPKVEEWQVRWDDLSAAMRAIATFSSNVLSIAEAAEGVEAIQPVLSALALLETEMGAMPSLEPLLPKRDLESIAARVAAQKDIISALQIAQPVLSDYAGAIIQMVGEADVVLDAAILELFESIGSFHAEMLAYRDNLIARQNAVLAQLKIMDRVWLGDESAWTELLAGNWVLSSEIGGNTKLSSAKAAEAEALLLGKLETVAAIRQHLEPVMLEYQAEMQELYEIEDATKASLQVGLLVIKSWDSAQRQLASGEKSGFSRFSKGLTSALLDRAVRR